MFLPCFATLPDLLNPSLYLCRIKKGAALKHKVCAARKKTSPAVAPATPVPTPNPIEEGTRTITAGPALGRARITPPSQWTEMTGKVTAPPSPPKAEAPANDAPTFPPIKAEAFDTEGYIKPE